MKSRMLGNMLVLFVMAAVMSSCEKMVLSESAGDDNQKKANVFLSVNGFEQVPFLSKTRSEAANACTGLCFYIYNEDGGKVDHLSQKLDSDEFGTASFLLDEGHYYLVVVGHSASKNPSFYDNEKVTISGTTLGDTFWCCEELEVGAEEVRKDLILSRIVSMVRFLSYDGLPDGADQMILRYRGSRGTFNGLTGYGSTTGNQTVDLSVMDTDRQFEFYLIPRDEEDVIDVKVTTYSHDNDVIHALTEKTISGIPLRRNYITICKGNLFDNDSSSKSIFLTIAVDDDWDGEIPVNF